MASKLSQASCVHSGPPASVGSVGRPHVLLRRIITALLHVLYEEAGQQGMQGEACRKTITQVGEIRLGGIGSVESGLVRPFPVAPCFPLSHPFPPALQVAPKLLLAPFSAALNCSRTTRTAMELQHISKSGGTSMCRLAVEAGGLRTHNAEMLHNCLVGAGGEVLRWRVARLWRRFSSCFPPSEALPLLLPCPHVSLPSPLALTLGADPHL